MDERQFSDFFELGLIGMAIASPDRTILEANSFICDMLGYSKDELIGKKWSDLTPQKDLKHNIDSLKQVLDGKIEGYSLDKQLIRKDGSIIQVSISTKANRNPDGSIKNLISLVQDITERKKAEESIRESELKYRTVVENAMEFIWQLDREGNFVFFNKYAEKLSRQKSSDWSSMDFSPLIHPDDLERVWGIFKDTMNGNTNEYEVRLVYKDDDILELSVQTLPIYEDGEVTGTLSFGRDVTEHKRIERNLTDSEERFRTLLANIPVGVFRSTIDAEGSFLSINNALVQMFGFDSQEEMLKVKVNDLYLNNIDRKKFLERLCSEDEISGFEVQLKRKDGSIFWGSLKSRAIRDENGDIMYLDGVLEDITSRKQTVEDLRESQERYRRLVDYNPAAIIVHVDRKIVYANRASLDLVNADDQDDVLGKDILDFVHPDYREIVIERARMSMQEGKYSEPIEEKFLTIDGKCIDVEVAAIPITYFGKPSTQVVFWNITNRKLAEEKIQNSLEELHRTLEGTVDALASAVEARDPYTAGHQKEVAKLSCAIAEKMSLPVYQIEGLRVASLLHDIGKIKIPAEILSKPTALSDMEYNLIMTHPQAGFDILKTITFPWPVGMIVLQHQERMDGSGYPFGLSGEEICLEARILAVADVVEAMCSHRPYRESRGTEIALEEIASNRGKLYDKNVVDACMRLFIESKFEHEFSS